ncbi:MAG: EF-hand domain-containing protein [Dongiaceae bacterium]
MISPKLACLGLAVALMSSSSSIVLADDSIAPGHARGAFMERFFKKVDVNGDGAVSRSEAEQAGDRMFAKLDTDGDGVVSEREFTEFRLDADLGAGKQQRWREHRARRFAAMDRDGDGVITLEEQADFGDRRFALADANGDGLLTLDEIRALHRKRGQP